MKVPAQRPQGGLGRDDTGRSVRFGFPGK